MAARERAPSRAARGAAGTLVPWKGSDLRAALAAGECRDISGAAGSGTGVSVYESPCPSGCEHAVLGVMVHEIRQTLV